MERFKSLDEILDFAITKEEEANTFYTNLSKIALRPEIKTVFKDFAAEELGHKKKLVAVRRGEYRLPPLGTVPNLKIADYTVTDDAGPRIAYQDALTLAMKKEEASYKLYSDLAKIAKDVNTQSLFLNLAQEEAKHKLRFEIEYDEHVLKEN